MAKNDNQNDVEDYLAQVEWEQQQSQRQPYIPLPWYMEPKRKSKKVDYSPNINSYQISPLAKTFLTILLGIVVVVLYKEALGLLIVFIGLGIFLLLMLRDANRKPKDDD